MNSIIKKLKQSFILAYQKTTEWLNAYSARITNHNPDAAQNLLQKRATIIKLISGTFLCLIIWAAFFEIEQSTRAAGQIIPSSRSQIIQSFDGGVLEQLLVKEGDEVEEKQILAKLDKTRMESSFLEARAKAAGLAGALARLKTEVFGVPLKFDPILNDYPDFVTNQKTLLSRRQKAIQEELKAIQNQFDLAKEELSMTEPLLKTGDVSAVEVLKLRRQVSDLASQIANKKNKYFQDSQAELNKVEEEFASISESLKQKQEQLTRIELVSPMAGIVKNVRVTTLGGVIKPGEEVMQIVPLGDDLLIEAKVKPSDIAFLKPGLDAIVKIDAYDYSIYGVMRGQVVYISADTLIEENKTNANTEQTYYRVHIKTKGKEFSSKPMQNLAIQPGMTVTAEIITGKHTVLSYITKPITKTFRSALTER
jgi:adhesin transport system membrane fusion protein